MINGSQTFANKIFMAYVSNFDDIVMLYIP